MATKGTYAAYKQAAVPQTDFAAEARKVLAGAEEVAARPEKRKKAAAAERRAEETLALKKRAQAFQEQLQKAKLESASVKQAQALQEKAFKDQIRLNTLANEALVTDTSGLMNPVLSEVARIGKETVAGLKKEYQKADLGRRVQIDAELKGMKNLVDGFKFFGEAGDKFFQNWATDIQTKYSRFQNNDLLIALNEGWMSANAGGLKKNADGSYNWGDRIRVDNLGKGDMELTLFDKDGTEVNSGSMGNFFPKLNSRLVPGVDLEKEYNSLARNMLAEFTTDWQDDGEMMRIIKKVNETATKNKIRARVRATYDKEFDAKGNTNNPFVKELYGTGVTGRNQFINTVTNQVYDRINTQTKEQIRNTPGLADKKKKQDLTQYGEIIKKAGEGDITALANAQSAKWPDAQQSVGVPANANIESIYRIGNTFSVTVGYKKGKEDLTHEFSYDLERPGTPQTVFNFLVDAINQGTGENYSAFDLQQFGVTAGMLREMQPATVRETPGQTPAPTTGPHGRTVKQKGKTYVWNPQTNKYEEQ